MKLNVSAKIVYSELVIIAVIYMTCIPYILLSMDFKPCSCSTISMLR